MLQHNYSQNIFVFYTCYIKFTSFQKKYVSIEYPDIYVNIFMFYFLECICISHTPSPGRGGAGGQDAHGFWAWRGEA
jgi:hypothetical protein